MNTQEIVNAINILNLKIEDVNSSLGNISKEINAFYVLFQGDILQLSQIFSEGLWDKYGTAIFGFFGVILGALITYLFNRRVNREERISRVVIQRKNLIYAPIYKELLKLNKYMEENVGIYYINIINTEDYNGGNEDYLYDGEFYQSGFFMVWNEMKKDIRKDYVPQKIQENLEEVNENLKIYIKERDKINTDFKKAYEESGVDELYGEADRKKFNKQKSDTILNLNTPSVLFKKSFDHSEAFSQEYKRYSTCFPEAEFTDFKNGLEKLFQSLPEKVNRKNLFDSYNELVKSILKATENTNKLIKHVINNYEFGKRLEGYDV